MFFNKTNFDYEAFKNEVLSILNNCTICNDKITPREDAEFSGKCEDCFYDLRSNK